MRTRGNRQKNNWFIPGLVATGLMALFAWQMDWFPLRIARTETGTLLSELESSGTDSALTPIVESTDFINDQPQTAPDFADELNDFGPSPATELHSNPFSDSVDMTNIPAQREPPEFAEDNNPFSDVAETVEQPTAIQPAAFEPPEFEPPTFADETNVPPASNSPFSNAPSQHADFSASQPAHAGFGSTATSKVQSGATQASYETYGPANARTAEPAALPPSKDAMPIPSADIAQRIATIDRLLQENDYLTAHSELSKIYWQDVNYRPLIKQRIEDTARSIYASPQPHYVKPYVVQPGDNLQMIAAKYKVPWKYLASLNRVDERKVRAGSKLKVNKGPFSALVDLSDFELTIHAHGFFVHRYTVGVGKHGTSPQGRFSVKQKLVNPTYYGPDGLVIEGDDPANPLGEHWIDLGDSYGIHGTIDPDSIGQARSRGCIRMRNEDVAEVFSLLSDGSEVVIRR